ncbi:hypothetical protein BC833DRAFT_570264 [Globomyces pollinis-pini]|nr:hypothetical protein BC833DRAFT_570264 [Globomyces pollinis-pini]
MLFAKMKELTSQQSKSNTTQNHSSIMEINQQELDIIADDDLSEEPRGYQTTDSNPMTDIDTPASLTIQLNVRKGSPGMHIKLANLIGQHLRKLKSIKDPLPFQIHVTDRYEDLCQKIIERINIHWNPENAIFFKPTKWKSQAHYKPLNRSNFYEQFVRLWTKSKLPIDKFKVELFIYCEAATDRSDISPKMLQKSHPIHDHQNRWILPALNVLKNNLYTEASSLTSAHDNPILLDALATAAVEHTKSIKGEISTRKYTTIHMRFNGIRVPVEVDYEDLLSALEKKNVWNENIARLQLGVSIRLARMYLNYMLAMRFSNN